MSQKAMLKTVDTKVEVTQPEVVKSLPDKIAEWTSIVGERGIAVKHDFVATFEELKRKDLILYRVEEITYEEDSPQLEALENALSCMTVPGMNLVYLILGSRGKVRPCAESERHFLNLLLMGTFVAALSVNLSQTRWMTCAKRSGGFLKTAGTAVCLLVFPAV